MKQNEQYWVETLEILNGIPHGVALLDRNGKVLMMNSRLESMSGYSSSESVGICAEEILRSHCGHKESIFAEALRRGSPFVVECDIFNGSRKKIPVRITSSPVRGGGTDVSRVLVVVEDITLEQKLDTIQVQAGPSTGILGNSLRMQEVFEFLPVVAQTDATLLITGETGTGKDLLAEATHQASKRAKYPFIKVNCGALPENLLESELFGHAKGAYTGAHADKPGMFRLAQGGTIYLTEIGDLSLPLQVKLLTVLDDRAFYPLGSSKKVEVDVRVITGTHRDLKDLVAKNRFRQDLFYRLNVLHVHLPALRDRDGDVRLLADHFLERFAKGLGKNIKGFSTQSMTILARYGYPGNVRELRNIVEYAASVCREEKIRPEHLPDYVIRGCSELPDAEPDSRMKADPPSWTGQSLVTGRSTWKDVEKKMIMEAMVEAKGNRGDAAKKLGWGRSTLWRKMKQYGLNE